MAYFVLLGVCTAVIAAFAFLLWLRTRNIEFPIGIGLAYYFSLHGAWSIITDRIGEDSGKTYSYLEMKLFPVQLDSYYVETIILYALFIILAELVLLFTTTPWTPDRPRREPVVIAPKTVLTLSLVAAVASMLLISGAILDAATSGTSVYMQTRGARDNELPAFFTIHQILNRVALMPSTLGLAVLFSGDKPRYVALEKRGKSVALGQALLLSVMVCFCLLLGNKNELLQAGLAGALFYLANCERPRYGLLAATGALGLLVLGVIDVLRSLPAEELLSTLRALDADNIKEASQFVTSSNEAFAAHFSMYGVLAYHVHITWGSSIVSLVASVIPRALWADRPPDVYTYYAQSVNAVEGQSYTIHHATGWYINFGIAGVIFGGLLLGWVWAYCFNASRMTTPASGRWRQLIRVMAPSLFVAALPSFLRAGPEAYKALVVEGLLLPTAIFALAAPRKAPAQIDSNA